MADHNTTAEVARSASPMPVRRKHCVKALRETCQRCFLRLEKFPDHHCVWSEGRKKCHYCGDVQHHCIPLPEEFQDEAEKAMLGPASELPSQVRVIRRKICNRTRNINQGKASKTSVATPAAETNAESESEDMEKDEDEDYDTDFAVDEQPYSSDEAYENSEMDAASEEQLYSSLTSTAAHEESEMDVAAEEQLQSCLAEEAGKLKAKKETFSWHSQATQARLKRWVRKNW
ncbi:hypothetical protein N7486_011075 [Penicillium sp. IBT 16267x]|nr:hypothetical protein N7486_011075 [Penicillium sp. IBT 16267x]